MNTAEVVIKISEDILNTLNVTKEEFSKEMKIYTAIELYREHKLSIGKAAELAEIPKTEFMYNLSNHGIPVIDYPIEDFEKEMQWLKVK